MTDELMIPTEINDFYVFSTITFWCKCHKQKALLKVAIYTAAIKNTTNLTVIIYSDVVIIITIVT